MECSKPPLAAPFRFVPPVSRGPRAGWVRYLVLVTLFLVSALNYADRAVLGLVGASVSHALALTPVAMGYVLSASSISYFLAQVPGGVLLDRFGSRWIYTGAIALWSLLTVAQGWVGLLHGFYAVAALVGVRLLFGIAIAPAVPANARIAASWFPTSERATAMAVFNSSQYLSLIVFAPVLGWIAHRLSWPWACYFLGALGLVAALVFPAIIRSPLRHPLIRPSELDYIKSQGALVDIETGKPGILRWHNLRPLAGDRLLLGLYLFQYCLIVLATFFMTWFPIYLVQQKGLSMVDADLALALPALFGLIGNLAGGLASDTLLRRTGSLTLARKLPVIAGLLLAMSIFACDFLVSRTAIITVMSIAFFGRGLAAMGWTMVSDISPQELIGVTGGAFNMISNVAAAITPIVMGYIVAATGSFNWAIAFVFLHCLVGFLAISVMIGRIRRVSLAAAE